MTEIFQQLLIDQFILKIYKIPLNKIDQLIDYVTFINSTYNKNLIQHNYEILNKLIDMLKYLSNSNYIVDDTLYYNEYHLIYNNEKISILQLNSVGYQYILQLTM